MLNVRSIRNKWLEVMDGLNITKSDIVSVADMWLEDEGVQCFNTNILFYLFCVAVEHLAEEEWRCLH